MDEKFLKLFTLKKEEGIMKDHHDIDEDLMAFLAGAGFLGGCILGLIVLALLVWGT